MVILVAMTWVVVLRRRVQQQTEIIRHKLEVEEELKERYVDLFENANDMVFTHDLQGRMTSINKAGERLLHRTRQEILSLNLVDLLVEEQRDQARKWIEQVVADTEVPSAEWDFLDVGRAPAFDWSSAAARWIGGGGWSRWKGSRATSPQRKRLERELLDISSREQRRIGHDLHDGVCQQLAGISLADQHPGGAVAGRGTGRSGRGGEDFPPDQRGQPPDPRGGPRAVPGATGGQRSGFRTRGTGQQFRRLVQDPRHVLLRISRSRSWRTAWPFISTTSPRRRC